ncbi:FUSC family protein [Phyllobacterium phragmitis]|uniref:FUSC family protein n=1 Tax=Phyllobacterium phragmitis TaxID=2670329 RepID=A0ABQ0H3L8_9HYPH
MTLPSWRDWLFSCKAFAAAMLALYIALALGLPRPYWAMSAVYIVSNPLAGATSSRGFYRALGTALGAGAGVLLVPLLVDAPELLSLVVALWTGTLLFISMLDRTARSYVFMLAGYTLPLVALPTVGAPETVFDVGLARAEEIIIGITCASIVSSVVFPTSVGTALSARISSWLDDAGNWADEILRGEGALPSTPLKRQKLAADVTGLDLVISQLGYDPGTRDIVQHSRELRGRMLMLLPLFSSLADRLHALKTLEGTLPRDLVDVLNAVAAWMKSGGKCQTDDRAAALLREIERLQEKDEPLGWNHLVRSSALARLKEIIDLWHDCLSLRDQIAAGRRFGPWRPAFRHRRVVAKAHHHDYALLAFSAGSVVLATYIASLVWIYTGWEAGAGFVAMVAVGCSFFASQDRPAPMQKAMLKWTVVSLPISFIYLYGILPAVTSYEMLVLAFAPPFLLLGLLIPRPQYFMLALLLCVNTASYVALQDRYSADFVSFLDGGIAAAAGIAFALVWTLLTRPFGAEIAAHRLMKAGWSDLAETASGAKRGDHEHLSGRILDRLGQLVPRLAAIENRDLKTVDGFADVRLGFNILMLQQECVRLGPSGAASIPLVLSGIADHYRAKTKTHETVDPPDALREHLDDSLRIILRDDAKGGRASIDALVGLRRILFPNAPPPEDWPVAQPANTHPPLAAE